MKFTAAAVQLAPAKADYAGNIAKVAEAIRAASKEGADVVVFPETALTGYFLEGGVGEVAVSAPTVASDLLEALGGQVERPVDVVVGFYELDGGTLYNAAAHIHFDKHNASLLHCHRKFFLPTYGVFDEERFVARGRDISAYDTRFGRAAILICEDVWHSVVPTIAALKGAELVFAVAASPARGFQGATIANVEKYHRLVTSFCDEHGVWAVNAMLVGFEGGKGFTGGSVIVNPLGEICAEGPLGEEYILLSEIDTELISIARSQSPLLADLQSVLEDVTREIDDVNRDLGR